jgi:hypothetical protein
VRVVIDGDDRALELAEVGIGVVEELGRHGRIVRPLP